MEDSSSSLSTFGNYSMKRLGTYFYHTNNFLVSDARGAAVQPWS